MVNLNEATAKIKAAGANKVRIVPMSGQPAINGLHRIEVMSESGSWDAVVENLPKTAAESIVTQATNRVICG